MKQKTQTSEVLRYLKEHKKGITNKQAFEMFGVTRLGSIIFELRKKHPTIETIIEDGLTRYGSSTRYARYVLHEED